MAATAEAEGQTVQQSFEKGNITPSESPLHLSLCALRHVRENVRSCKRHASSATVTSSALSAASAVIASIAFSNPAVESIALRAYRAAADDASAATSSPRDAALLALDDVSEEISDCHRLVQQQSSVPHICSTDIALCVSDLEESLSFLSGLPHHTRSVEAILLDCMPPGTASHCMHTLMQEGLTVLSARCSNAFALASKANVCMCATRAIFACGGALVPAGGKLLALAAQAHSLPLLLVGSTHKLCSSSMASIANTPDDARFRNFGAAQSALPRPYDLLARAESNGANLQAVSPQCDFIEPELISYYVLDTGTHVPARINELVDETLGSVSTIPDELQPLKLQTRF